MKTFLTLLLALFCVVAHSQQKQKSVEIQFCESGAIWPPAEIYIRIFKQEKLLELWTKGLRDSGFTLFKSYLICKLSGRLGPKRREGDLQVPEGFYVINHYNSRSRYYLSLGLNYPNSSDSIASLHKRAGGLIYIHGDCVSVGCIAMGNESMLDIYALANTVHANGQEKVQVHIFPFNFCSDARFKYSLDYSKNEAMKSFLNNLEAGFNLFEKTRKTPVVNVNVDGKYIFSK